MAFDYKKEYKEFYMPPKKPTIVEIPKMNFIAVRGKGNPNEEDGEYSKAVGLLYGIAYTLKMSYKGNYKIKDYFQYVVPPLEGFWWQEGIKGVDYSNKDSFKWISIIRIPDFIRKEDFEWAIEEATRKKKIDYSKVEFLTYEEGFAVQCMHIGPYDDEPKTVEAMHKFALENGYKVDINEERYHHEIYISDPRKCDISRLKTVVRHPIKKID
ncbi:MAG: GyrI-like domain-containing protein [Clostridium sp.]|uniref:GyrI-like domain-containing protein n=1 Tax=Clostridium sp. TaxID=1506 RepID=UPI00290C33DB|nr:GyrI-like domain-containing protein [Clostridium sp.]MDU5109721.1 GyrI-like domain-containing protein [Clostridium sp.]